MQDSNTRGHSDSHVCKQCYCALDGNPDQILPYDGTQPGDQISNVWVCGHCFEEEPYPGAMLVCDSCEIMRYCDEVCMLEDLDHHAQDCETISELTGIVDICAARLRNNGADAFKEFPGSFWNFPETRGYCVVVNELIDTFQSVVNQLHVRPLLELILSHRLELLRLSRLDALGLRFLVPFDLLGLYRDDDCYAFIKHHLTTSFVSQGAERSPDPHQNSEQGDWIYPRNEDKFEDVLQLMPADAKTESIPLTFLAALSIMKLRIIETHYARSKHFVVFESTKCARVVGLDNLSVIKRMYVGATEDGKIIKHQEAHVDHYLRIIHSRNPEVLRAICDPSVLEDRYVCQDCYHADDVEEVLRFSLRLFQDIPNIYRRLEEIIGTTRVQ